MITLEQIRIHCRVDDEAENALLEQYRFAALEMLKNYTCRNWYGTGETIPETDPDGLHFNAAANQAMLLMVGAWYADREGGTGTSQVPPAAWHLIQPYRIYGV